MKILFILSFAVIFYTYLGYPIGLFLLSIVAARPVKKGDFSKQVSIFILTDTEIKDIGFKINTFFELGYPREKIEILIGCDGAANETYRIIKKFADENKIRYAVSFEKIGRLAMINKLTKDARGEIFIFTDIKQKFDQDILKQLLGCFTDAEVGFVSADLLNQEGVCFWYEKFINKMESSIGSIVTARGALYAVRKELFRYLPQGIFLDDTYASMNTIAMRKRAVFEPAAKSYGYLSNVEGRFKDIIKVVVGYFRIFASFAEEFNPFRNITAFLLLSHRFAMCIVPYFLILFFILNIFLLSKGIFFVSVFIFQAIFYCFAVLGWLFEKLRDNSKVSFFKALYAPYEFCVFNFAAVAALYLYLQGVEFDN